MDSVSVEMDSYQMYKEIVNVNFLEFYKITYASI